MHTPGTAHIISYASTGNWLKTISILTPVSRWETIQTRKSLIHQIYIKKIPSPSSFHIGHYRCAVSHVKIDWNFPQPHSTHLLTGSTLWNTQVCHVTFWTLEPSLSNRKNKLKKPTQFFITNETYKDLEICINGFIALCTISLPDTPIIPALVNSDVVENVFCMQRSL